MMFIAYVFALQSSDISSDGIWPQILDDEFDELVDREVQRHAQAKLCAYSRSSKQR